jgi:hypothetical protein
MAYISRFAGIDVGYYDELAVGDEGYDILNTVKVNTNIVI